ASERIRGKQFAEARALLDLVAPASPEHEVERAYCLGYCAAAEGYRALGDGDRGAARRLLFEALAAVESRLGDARTLRHDRLLELHAKLEADMGLVEGAEP
ncbi:MAG TPA: hypothetical protein VF469_01990, partial [Kofleriaceae bacterium]